MFLWVVLFVTKMKHNWALFYEQLKNITIEMEWLTAMLCFEKSGSISFGLWNLGPCCHCPFLHFNNLLVLWERAATSMALTWTSLRCSSCRCSAQSYDCLLCWLIVGAVFDLIIIYKSKILFVFNKMKWKENDWIWWGRDPGLGLLEVNDDQKSMNVGVEYFYFFISLLSTAHRKITRGVLK